MGIVQAIAVLTMGAIVPLCFGYYGLLKKKYAVTGAALSILLGGALLLLAVLPGNSVYGPVLYEGSGAAKTVALTFDDGPYPPYTQQVLEVLRKKKVPATFFVVGVNAERYPELVREESAQGHLVGAHSYNHVDLLRLRDAELAAEFAQAKRAVQAATGKEVRYLRPPHGFKDWRVLSEARKAGLTAVNWSVMAKDWTNPGVEAIVNRVVGKVKPGSIVLLHDGDSPENKGSREQTVLALSIIIDKLRAEGYTFVTVDKI